jgi:hypothetical protein
MHLPLNIKSAPSEAMLGTALKLENQQHPWKTWSTWLIGIVLRRWWNQTSIIRLSAYIAFTPYCSPSNPSNICCVSATECTNITTYSKCLKSSVQSLCKAMNKWWLWNNQHVCMNNMNIRWEKKQKHILWWWRQYRSFWQVTCQTCRWCQSLH